MPLGGGRIIMFHRPDVSGIPTHSIDFGNTATKALSMAEADFGAISATKFSFSVWVKKTATGSASRFFAKTTAGNTAFSFNQTNLGRYTFEVHKDVGGGVSGVAGAFTVTATYDDTNWHHILLHVDTANATADSRMRIWVDGSEVLPADWSGYTPHDGSDVFDEAAMTWSYAGGDGDPSTSTAGNCLIYQGAFSNGVLLAIANVYSAGKKSLSPIIASLTSQLDTDGGTNSGADTVLVADWIIHGAAAPSTDIPA